MIRHNIAMFGSYRYYASGNMMFLMVEGKNSTCSRLNLPLLFSLKQMVWHVHT